ncbi:MAG TPA: histidine kinase [Streptosporangiaceae bacterium]|jgi:signal transduction histidine kinase
MVSSISPAPPAGAARTDGYPFRGPGALARAAPFAAIAALAEASLALPPLPADLWPVLISLLLLLAIPPAFVLLPWPRLPHWAPVLVPLTYTGSVLALIFASGVTAGVGIVILVPLIWTALYHRPWESACVVVAIVIVEIITSLTPVTDGGTVLARRIFLWAALATVISVAVHTMRARIGRGEQERARLEERLRALSLLEDRDRIAADLQDKVIQRVFAAGLNLQGTAALIRQPEARSRVESAVDELDHVIRVLRDAIFGLQQRTRGQGLRARIQELGAQLSPAPAMSFTGPVDGALPPIGRAQLLDVLHDALTEIGRYSVPARVDLAVHNSSLVAVVETAFARDGGADANGGLGELEARAKATGMSLETEAIEGGRRFTWRVPAGPGATPRRR